MKDLNAQKIMDLLNDGVALEFRCSRCGYKFMIFIQPDAEAWEEMETECRTCNVRTLHKRVLDES